MKAKAPERSISISDMRFEAVRVNRQMMNRITVVVLLVSCQFLIVTPSYAEVIERIVAIVNEDIILLSEFQSVLLSSIEPDSPAVRERVLNEMIDNMLLLNEAKKYRISALDKANKAEIDNSIIVGEYIDRRIKALIHVPYEDIERYYQMNSDLFRGKEIIDVRDAIEEQLVETELRIKLREHLGELRKKAYVRTQLNREQPAEQPLL
jgi:hypothetical protein